MSNRPLHLCLLGLFVSASPVAAAENTIVSDDFGADSGRWTYVGAAYRDSVNGYIVLTDTALYAVGQIWLDTAWTQPFKASFRYWTGGGSLSADGLVFMFYKQSGYEPDTGRSLGFSTPPHNSLTPVPGYGVEVDEYPNDWLDPLVPHMSLIQNHSGDHLAWVADSRTDDSAWHTVVVQVDASSVVLNVDDSEVFRWDGAIDSSFARIGFSAANGGGSNFHIIDDVRIEARR